MVEGTNVYFNPISNTYTFSGIVKKSEEVPALLFMVETIDGDGIQCGWPLEILENMKLVIDGNVIDNPKQYITNMNGINIFMYPLNDNNEHVFEIEINEIPKNPWLFHSSASAISLNLNDWDTSGFIDMTGMFYQCLSLITLDLSNWDTSNVTDMHYMFDYCLSLTSINLSNWDTSNVTDMSQMFWGCYSLTSLDLSKWDVSNVTSMYGMFSNCTSLSEVKMGGNPSKVTKVTSMFYNITTNGTFYYNSAYDYSKILGVLPSTWTAVPCTMVDGVLVPNN